MHLHNTKCFCRGNAMAAESTSQYWLSFAVTFAQALKWCFCKCRDLQKIRFGIFVSISQLGAMISSEGESVNIQSLF